MVCCSGVGWPFPRVKLSGLGDGAALGGVGGTSGFATPKLLSESVRWRRVGCEDGIQCDAAYLCELWCGLILKGRLWSSGLACFGTERWRG